jgi:uncharacterized protein (DUF433 family)
MSRIISNPKILGGKPIIKGTRISVEFIMELVASGMTVGEIIKAYPFLKQEDVMAALRYTAKVFKKQEVILA